MDVLLIIRRNISYFSYFMWAACGSWKDAVQEMRDRDMVTLTQKR